MDISFEAFLLIVFWKIVKYLFMSWVLLEVVIALTILVFPRLRQKYLNVNRLSNSTLLVFILIFIKINLISEQKLGLGDYFIYRKKQRAKESIEKVPEDVTNILDYLKYKKKREAEQVEEMMYKSKITPDMYSSKVPKKSPVKTQNESKAKTASDFINKPKSKEDVNDLF